MAATAMHASPTLLAIPLELRLLIFALCMPDLALEYHCQLYPGNSPSRTPNKVLFIKPTKECTCEYTVSRRLLFVCRSVRREALPIFRSSFKSLKPAQAQTGMHNPSTVATANLHRDVNASIQTLGFRDHLEPLPDHTEFSNLKTIEVDIHQGRISQSYHTMSDHRLLAFVTQWLNIRSWQNSILWGLIFDQEDKALVVNVVGSVTGNDGFNFVEVSPSGTSHCPGS